MVILLSIPSLSAQDCVPEDKVIKTTIMGRDYEFITVKKNWDDANECAKERGGYLIDIQSQEENDSLMHFLLNTLRYKYSFNLLGQGEENIWLGCRARYDSSEINPIYHFWEWQNLDSLNERSLITTQKVSMFQGFKNNFIYADGKYLNWGEGLSGYHYPTEYEFPFQNKVAISLVDVIVKENNEKVAIPGKWITTFPEEEKYFMIDYGCVNPIKNVIDTLVCFDKTYPFGDSTISTAGFYTKTFNSFSNCDSVVELTIDFASINNEMTKQSDRLQSKELNAESYKWYNCKTDTPIEGKNEFFLVINETGSYRLELEKNGCDFITECYDFCIPTTFKIDTVKCANESITINGQEYEKKGFYSQKLKQEGFDCDSTLEIDIKDVAINLSVKQQSGKLVSSESAGEYQWYNCEGDVLIADATQKEYTPTENGDYKVEITKQGCIDYSQCISFSTSTNSVKDIQDSDNIRLDLNNNLIVFDNINYDQIELLDMNSKTIYKSDKYAQSISIEHLNTGVYFLKVSNGKEIEMFKFMVVE
jgi:hypothetical protein